MARISDVAARAGVSPATVSRHMSGSTVRGADRIAAAIAELDYRPSSLARGLRSGRQGCIGIIVPDIANPLFSALVNGVESGLAAVDMRVLLANSNEDPAREAEVVADLADRTDGLILFPPNEADDVLVRTRARRGPVVFVDRLAAGPEVDTVVVDNVGGGRMAAEHLLALGHRRVGVISGPLSSTPGRERHEGFLEALRRAGVPVDPEHVVASDFKVEGGYTAMSRLLSTSRPPTAVFSGNNLMTIGAMRSLTDHHVPVPDQMSLLGFDDLELADLLCPPLTVIDRPTFELGSKAAEVLVRRIRDPAAPREHLVLPVELLLRRSTARPRRSTAVRASQPATVPAATTRSVPQEQM